MDVCLVSRGARVVLLGIIIALGVLDGAGNRESHDAASAPLDPDSTVVRTEGPPERQVAVDWRLAAASAVD